MDELKPLEERLGYSFKKRQNLVEALTHKSYKKPYNNERLEFLGDAVLDLVVGEYLYERFPNAREGELSKMRASLVNEAGFKRLADALQLGEYIYISPAEENNRGRDKPSLLSNAFEALMGAIYLESGLDEVRRITIDLIEASYPKIDLSSLFKDYKTTLQELTQAKFGVIPDYMLKDATGPDHNKEFEVQVYVNDRLLATAKGKSKKSAQQEAAHVALKQLKKKDSK
ncbi:ribonuclease III [Hydrogenimonas sp.]